MGSETLTKVTEYTLAIWLAIMAVTIAYRLLMHHMTAGGFLQQGLDEPHMAPERVQLMGAFLFALAGYAIHAIVNGPVSTANGLALPDVPQALLVLMGGSQSLYLAGKIGRKLNKGSGS